MAALALEKPVSALGWLRILLRVGLMAAALLVCIVLHYACRPFTHRRPAARLFLFSICWIGGIDVRIEGECVRRGAFLLANHVSWIDIPAISLANGAAFVGHDGLASMPLLRWLCRMNDTVFVARHDRASVQEQVQQVRAAIRDTGALAIFPEGTTSDGTGLLPFKSSLLSALDPVPPGVAVQPVLLDYGAETAAIAWVGTEHGVDNFLRILARGRPLAVTVRFLPPLHGAALVNRKTMASAAREAILAALQR
ncbi:MAG: 1-acyl-sn-glycerol-3-phosphate acyltransferase [Sphingomonadales bacterium]|nr:1-acyl-sn-glycerol-3-phosphate acyltransferase [Sphingomonadales bacterium]